MRQIIKCIRGFYMSLGMFCNIRLPFYIWDDRLAIHMITTLPLVGLIIGTLWWLCAILLTFLNIPIVLTAAVLCVALFLITGFIHLDGYMDTEDAILSHRPLPDKLRILQDSNAGAFSVVSLCIMFILQFGAMYAALENGKYFAMLIVIAVLSRCCTAVIFISLRHIPQCPYASMLTEKISISHKIFPFIISVTAIALSFLYAGFFGLAISAAVILGYIAAICRVFKSFKGITGDLAGYALVISELCGLIAFAVLPGVRNELWF